MNHTRKARSGATVLVLAVLLSAAAFPGVARGEETARALSFDQIDRTSLAGPIPASSSFEEDYRNWSQAREKGQILSEHAFEERVGKLLQKKAQTMGGAMRTVNAVNSVSGILDSAHMVPGLGSALGTFSQGFAMFSSGTLDLTTIASLIPGPTGMIAKTVLSFLPSKFKQVHFGPNASALSGVPISELEQPLLNEQRIGRLTHYTISGQDVRIDDPLGERAILVLPGRGKIYRLDLLAKTYTAYAIPAGENPLAFLTGGVQPAHPDLRVADSMDGSSAGHGETAGMDTEHFEAEEHLSVTAASSSCAQSSSDVAMHRSDDVANIPGPGVLPFYPFDAPLSGPCTSVGYAASGTAANAGRLVMRSRGEMRSSQFTFVTLTERGNVVQPSAASVRSLFDVPANFEPEIANDV